MTERVRSMAREPSVAGRWPLARSTGMTTTTRTDCRYPLSRTACASTYAIPSTFAARWITASDASVSPGPASAHRRAARLRAEPRYPFPTGMASPASRPIPTPRGSSAADESSLQVDGGSQCLAGRDENDERLVAAELEEKAVARAHDLRDEVGESGREGSTGLVAVLAGVRRVAPDVSDEKRPQFRLGRGGQAHGIDRRLRLAAGRVAWLGHVVLRRQERTTQCTSGRKPSCRAGPTLEAWSRRWDSNPRPSVYETAKALSVACVTYHDVPREVASRPPWLLKSHRLPSQSKGECLRRSEGCFEPWRKGQHT